MTTQPLTSEMQSELENDLLDWTRELLEDPSIRPDDNFLDAGGHSLVATRLNVLLKEKYGLKIPLRTLFEDSLTVAATRAVAA